MSVFSRAYIKGQTAVDTNFDVYFFNSIFIAGSSVLIALIIGTLAAYGFSRYPLRGNNDLSLHHPHDEGCCPRSW